MADANPAGMQDVLSAILNTNKILSQLVIKTGQVFPQITTTQTTVGAAGGASALPATPLGYLNITLPSGTAALIPYYTA